MQVILDEGVAEDWMNLRERDPLSLKRLLVSALSDLLVMLSRLVNSVRNQGPEFLVSKESQRGFATFDIHLEARRGIQQNATGMAGRV